MLFFVFDLLQRVASFEYLGVFGCCLTLVFFVSSVGSLLSEVVALVPKASFYQCLYLTLTTYLDSVINYFVIDACVFSTLYLVFAMCRKFVFKQLTNDEEKVCCCAH